MTSIITIMTGSNYVTLNFGQLQFFASTVWCVTILVLYYVWWLYFMQMSSWHVVNLSRVCKCRQVCLTFPIPYPPSAFLHYTGSQKWINVILYIWTQQDHHYYILVNICSESVIWIFFLSLPMTRKKYGDGELKCFPCSLLAMIWWWAQFLLVPICVAKNCSKSLSNI